MLGDRVHTIGEIYFCGLLLQADAVCVSVSLLQVLGELMPVLVLPGEVQYWDVQIGCVTHVPDV